MTHLENALQHAITAALEVYCDRAGGPRLELFAPYPPQQSAKLRKFCGDLVASLSDSRAMVLEIKERDCEANILPNFDAWQHRECLFFERMGVPIAYAYNMVPWLEYHAGAERRRNWPDLTLSQVKRSEPSRLPNSSPAHQTHSTLLDWLTAGSVGNSMRAVGRARGMFTHAHELRNGALMLLYGVKTKTLNALTADDLDKVVNFLNAESVLSKANQHALAEILGGEAEIFSSLPMRPKRNAGTAQPGGSAGTPSPPTPGRRSGPR